jgi:hypothetical protein
LGALWIRLQGELQAAPELGLLKWAIREIIAKYMKYLEAVKLDDKLQSGLDIQEVAASLLL